MFFHIFFLLCSFHCKQIVQLGPKQTITLKSRKPMEPPPNVEFIGAGYDIYIGNPLSLNGIDKGFRLPVFVNDDYEYVRKIKFLPTGDGFLLPKGINARDAESCKTSFTSKTVDSTKSYKRELSYCVSVEGSSSYSGLFASGSASFSFSMDSNSVEKGTSNRRNVFIYSSAFCSVYQTSLIRYTPPDLHPAFLTAVSKLPKIFTDKNKEIFFDFIENYGTHITTDLVMGARFTIKSKFSSSDYEKMKSSNMNIQAGASASASAGTVSGGVFGGFGMVKDKQSAKTLNTKRKSKTIFSIGARPPENGDANQWAADTKLNPVPIRYNLAKLTEYYVYVKSIKKYIIDDVNKRRALDKAEKVYVNNLSEEKSKKMKEWNKKLDNNRPWYEKSYRCPDGWRFQKFSFYKKKRYVVCYSDSFTDDLNIGICFNKRRFEKNNYLKHDGFTYAAFTEQSDRCRWSQMCKVHWDAYCKRQKYDEFSHWSFADGICPDDWVKLGYYKEKSGRDYVSCKARPGSMNRGNGKCGEVGLFSVIFDRCGWSKRCGVKWKVCDPKSLNWKCPWGWILKKGKCYWRQGFRGKMCSPARFLPNGYDACLWAKNCGYVPFWGCGRSKHRVADDDMIDKFVDDDNDDFIFEESDDDNDDDINTNFEDDVNFNDDFRWDGDD